MINEKRIIINTFGSFGDLHPYMSLAAELQVRGHEPVIATMEVYREKVEQEGLAFASVRPDVPAPSEQSRELIEKILDPKSGPRFLTEQLVFPAVRDSYEDLRSAVRDADLLITHPAAPAGPLVAQKTGINWISTVLSPLSFFSAYDPPVPPYWSWLAKLRVLGPGVMRALLKVAMSAHKARLVTDFRDELGLADYGNPIFEGQHSPARVLALFSSVFAQTQPDWPPQTRTTGFCFYEGRHQGPLPPELERFLDAGEPPIVFTLGSSAVWVAKDFFQQSIEAAENLRRRGVLLIGDTRNNLSSLPANFLAVDYAPYYLLLPRAAAVVHSGGIGTTSEALRAGVPTLIVPFAFDQMDNADHARRLGTSRTLARKHYKARRVTKELACLLSETSYAHNAQMIAEKLRAENGPACAADYIEEFLTATNSDRQEPIYAASH